MGTSAFPSVFGGVHGLRGLEHEVLEFESFNKISVPIQGFIAYGHLVKKTIDFVDFFNALFQARIDSEDGSVHLHGGLHFFSDLPPSLNFSKMSVNIEKRGFLWKNTKKHFFNYQEMLHHRKLTIVMLKRYCAYECAYETE